MLRLTYALLMSRFRYDIPYTNFNKNETTQLDTLIRETTKLALGVAINSNTQLLEQTGSYSILQELISVHKRRQGLRLSLTAPGRAILSSIDVTPTVQPPLELKVPPHNTRHSSYFQTHGSVPCREQARTETHMLIYTTKNTF